MALAVLAAALPVALGACGGGDDPPEGDGPQGAGVVEPELRDELLAMQEDDQAERMGEVSGPSGDAVRTQRLGEIFDEHGWPGADLVGEDGSTAAWVIAQHSDLDVEFQERALDLLEQAVDEGQASPGDLAYLTDRVAANHNEPQVYGTQIGCVDGEAQVGPLQDPESVDERRAEAGLGPLEDYLAELRPECEAEAADAGAGAPPPG
jgi:hypothetical protein